MCALCSFLFSPLWLLWQGDRALLWLLPGYFSIYYNDDESGEHWSTRMRGNTVTNNICIKLYTLQSTFAYIIVLWFMEHLLYIRGFLYNSSDSHGHTQREVFSSSVYKSRNWGSQNLNDLSVNIQTPTFERCSLACILHSYSCVMILSPTLHFTPLHPYRWERIHFHKNMHD